MCVGGWGKGGNSFCPTTAYMEGGNKGELGGVYYEIQKYVKKTKTVLLILILVMEELRVAKKAAVLGPGAMA